LAKGVENGNLEENTTLEVGSLTRRVTWLTRLVYKKKAKFKSILTFSEFTVRKHIEKERFMVLEKMDPNYSSGSLS
jgi:hypothetical protein